MPLAKFVLILVCVIAAGGLTVAAAALLGTALEMPVLGLALLPPVLALCYILWRVIADRVTSAEDDRYDRIPQ